MNNMAFFLIQSKRDIYRGIGMTDSALSIDPGNYTYLETKGWGMHRLGKEEEAYDILRKTSELREKEGMFNPFADMHFDSVKMALGRLK